MKPLDFELLERILRELSAAPSSAPAAAGETIVQAAAAARRQDAGQQAFSGLAGPEPARSHLEP